MNEITQLLDLAKAVVMLLTAVMGLIQARAQRPRRRRKKNRRR